MHAALRKVEDKSRDTYDESMLLISVNGDKNDEEDRYLNGYSTLHMKKHYLCFQQTLAKATLS